MRRGKTAVLLLLILILLVVVVLSIGSGAVRVPPLSILRLLLHGIGIHSIELPPEMQLNIILHIRLPRVVAAMLVGAEIPWPVRISSECPPEQVWER